MNSTKAVESRLLIILQILQQTSTTRHPYHGSLLNPRRFRGIVRGASRSSTISWARASESERLSESWRLSSLSQKMSRLVLSRFDEFVVIIITRENIAGQI